MVGGMIGFNPTASVDIYDIKEGTWKEGPALKEARYLNSSCQQGNFVYTFSGSMGRGCLSSIEFLNAKKYHIEGDKTHGWTEIPFNCPSLTPRSKSSFVSISNEELLIVGGNDGARKSDVHKVNTEIK